jgi:hypothetical protein
MLVIDLVMDPRPAQGETRAEFEARWKAVSDELAEFTQETQRMVEKMIALPWWRMIRMTKMLDETQDRQRAEQGCHDHVVHSYW